MTADEQEYESRRYAAPRLTLLRLSSGNIAVGRGFNPPDLLYICTDPQDLWDYVCGMSEAYLTEARHALEREARLHSAPPDLDLDLNLDNLELNL